jgi:hypothetical protein
MSLSKSKCKQLFTFLKRTVPLIFIVMISAQVWTVIPEKMITTQQKALIWRMSYIYLKHFNLLVLDRNDY